MCGNKVCTSKLCMYSTEYIARDDFDMGYNTTCPCMYVCRYLYIVVVHMSVVHAAEYI